MAKRRSDISLSVGELAEKVAGVVDGDRATRVSGLCSLDEPCEGGISFARSVTDSATLAAVNKGTLAALLVPTEAALPSDVRFPALIRVKDPLVAMATLVPVFFEEDSHTPGVHPKAEVHATAQLGKGVSIGAYCVVGEAAVVGDGAVLHPHVVLYPRAEVGAGAHIHAGAIIREDCKVGPRSVIQNGAVIGADGFGYFLHPERGLTPIPQVGSVALARQVEVGANSCIDRATFGSTQVGASTKIDNLVQVGHNVKIGSNTILCGQVGIAGSTIIGDRVTLGGNVGVKDHVRIGNDVRVAAKSGVTNDLLEKGDYAGFPPRPVAVWRRELAAMAALPARLKDLRALLKKKDTP